MKMIKFFEILVFISISTGRTFRGGELSRYTFLQGVNKKYPSEKKRKNICMTNYENWFKCRLPAYSKWVLLYTCDKRFYVFFLLHDIVKMLHFVTFLTRCIKSWHYFLLCILYKLWNVGSRISYNTFNSTFFNILIKHFQDKYLIFKYRRIILISYNTFNSIFINILIK